MTHRISATTRFLFFFLLSCVIRADGGLHIHAFGVVLEILLIFSAAPELNVGILNHHWLIAGVKEPESITVRRNLCLIS